VAYGLQCCLAPSELVLRVAAFSILAVSGLISCPSVAQPAESDPRVGSAAAVRRLREEIDRYDQLYHRDGASEITDSEYDSLTRQLAELEAKVGGSLPISGERPSGHSDHVDGFVLKPHGVPMLSLRKAYTREDLLRFYEKVRGELRPQNAVFVIEPKFDGVAVSVVYQHGRLDRILTRGDGDRGDDVTANARNIPTLPDYLRPITDQVFPTKIEIRGEVFIHFDDFKRLNQARESAAAVSYATPRHAAAGLLKSTDPDLEAIRCLSVVFYGVGTIEPRELTPDNHSDIILRIRSWALPTLNHPQREARSFDALWSAVSEFSSARAILPFPTDGVVVKVDSIAHQRILGSTQHSPRWAVAYKFASERHTTRLRAITLQVGRTGLITPVAELDPVEMAGVVISRASLHNAGEIRRRDLRLGDTVVVERAGEVIPVIVAVDLSRRSGNSHPYVFPSECPGCEATLVQGPGETAWKCVNFDCVAQLNRRIQHFASCVGIRGLGEAGIRRLIDTGLLRDVADLYQLSTADLVRIDEIGNAEAVIASIHESRTSQLWRFIQGFGIPSVGKTGSRVIAQRYKDFASLAGVRRHELVELEGLGNRAAVRAYEFFTAALTTELLQRLAASGVRPSAES
jgi:DNA ligase (NAD+)